MNYVSNWKIKNIIKRALAEDIGRGDITAKLLFPKAKKIQAVILAGESGIICGLDIARLAFKLLDRNTRFVCKIKDGARVRKGQRLVRVYGRASSILSAERVALNFLGLLSGIATRTEQFLNKVKGCRIKIMDTRKTIPGLRGLEKYAVRIGGGYNHRFGLDEMVLVKDNHFGVMSRELRVMSLKDLLKRIRKKLLRRMKIEVEVGNLKEFKQALQAKPDIIMLDNMKTGDIKKAVAIKRKAGNRVLLEASGNINIKNIRAYAQSGVDFISLGTLTKDIHCLDLSLEVKG